MMNSKRLLGAATGLIALGCWACGGDAVETNPAPVVGTGGAAVGGSGGSEVGGSGGSGGSAGSAGVGGSAGSAGVGGSAGSAGVGGSGPVVRTIIVRDVFENFDAPDNLMLDGGFELSGEMSITWTAYNKRTTFGNGAACRTGVRCGVASKNYPIFGFFVSPSTGSIEITLHTRTDGAPCDAMTMAVMDGYSLGQGTIVPLSSASLEADGWCSLKGTTGALGLARPLLFLEPNHGKAHIDDVVIRPVSSTTALSATPAAPLPAALQAHAKRIRARAAAILENRPGTRRSIRAGAPWTAEFDPWIR